jgi:hypothetical protein
MNKRQRKKWNTKSAKKQRLLALNAGVNMLWDQPYAPFPAVWRSLFYEVQEAP